MNTIGGFERFPSARQAGSAPHGWSVPATILLKPGAHGDAMLTGEMHGLFLLECVAVAMLIMANGFFVAAEFALVSIRETRIEQMLADRVPGARSVLKLQRDLNDFLPAVQLGVTLCSLALGWIGEPLVADGFQALFGMLPHPMAHAKLVSH